jgi:DNA-binding response OmpR family regulator
MVVDDDPDTAAVIIRNLEREGYKPIEANSGAECLKLAHESEVDLILLDVMMPGMDGFQTCRALREDPATAEIPVILCTARDDMDARVEGIKLGVGDFLAKPIPRRTLSTRVRAQLEIVATKRKTAATLNKMESGQKD